MKIIQGDLIRLTSEGNFDVIVHGCNCFCTMGAGIAKTIKQKFPEAFDADCKTLAGDKNKLGSFTRAEIHRGTISFYIINAYTQYDWRGSGIKADYTAIENVFRQIKKEFSGKRIGYPAMGAGLAGGDWSVISSIINQELTGEDHTFVEFVR